MFGIGAGELVLILIVGLIVFGPGHLPEVGRAIGKGLKEFRKAQAALSATLEEVSTESTNTTSKTEDKKVSIEKIPDEKISVTEPPPHSAMTVDDVITLAKENPLNKENKNEKISDGNADNPVLADGSASNVDSRGNSNGTGKQPEPAKN